jgi:hypothetical protein
VRTPEAWLEILAAGHDPGLSVDEIFASRAADAAPVDAELVHSRMLGTVVKFTTSN